MHRFLLIFIMIISLLLSYTFIFDIHYNLLKYQFKLNRFKNQIDQEIRYMQHFVYFLNTDFWKNNCMCFELNGTELEIKIHGYNILCLTKIKNVHFVEFYLLIIWTLLKLALLHFRLSEYQTELDQLKEEYLF